MALIGGFERDGFLIAKPVLGGVLGLHINLAPLMLASLMPPSRALQPLR